MGNLPEVLQGAQISSTHNKTGHPYHALWYRHLGSSKMVRICLKNKVCTSQLVNTNIKWHFHDTRRTFKTKCKLLSWQTSVFGKQWSPDSAQQWGVTQVVEAVMKSETSKCEQCPHSGRTFPPASLSSPLWADTRGAGADREQAEPSMVIPDGNQLDSSLTLSTQSHVDLPRAQGLSHYCQARQEICSRLPCVKYLQEPMSHWSSCTLGHD